MPSAASEINEQVKMLVRGSRKSIHEISGDVLLSPNMLSNWLDHSYMSISLCWANAILNSIGYELVIQKKQS